MNGCAFRGWVSDCQLPKRDPLREYSYLLRLIRWADKVSYVNMFAVSCQHKALMISRYYIQFEISFHYAAVCVASK
jgi:hypothetical protein